MPRPQMVVAGPPGSGKSSRLPLRGLAVDYFNADDRAAQLHGSYLSIPREVRERVNAEFEAFVGDRIAARRSFALETTLRSRVTFQQAHAARRRGFETVLLYVALERFDLNLERVATRAEAGGHSAPASVLQGIWVRSLDNLAAALSPANLSSSHRPEPDASFVFDLTLVYDNSSVAVDPQLVLEVKLHAALPALGSAHLGLPELVAPGSGASRLVRA